MTIDDNFKKFDVPDQFSDMCLEVRTEKFHVAKWLFINQEKSKRSIKDIYRLGNVFEKREVKFCPKPSVKSETKNRQVRDTEDDNEEDDVGGMPSNRRKLPPKKRCSVLDHSSSSGTVRNQSSTPASAQNQSESAQSPAPTSSSQPSTHLPQRPVQNSGVPAAGIPIAEQAPPARLVKSEEPHEIIFDNGWAPQPSVPQTSFFLTLFRGLVAMVREKQVEVLKSIDEVIQPPENKDCREQLTSNYEEQHPGTSGANDAAPVSQLEDAKFPVGTHTIAIFQFNNTMNLGFVVTLLNDIKPALVLIDRDA